MNCPGWMAASRAPTPGPRETWGHPAKKTSTRGFSFAPPWQLFTSCRCDLTGAAVQVALECPRLVSRIPGKHASSVTSRPLRNPRNLSIISMGVPNIRFHGCPEHFRGRFHECPEYSSSPCEIRGISRSFPWVSRTFPWAFPWVSRISSPSPVTFPSVSRSFRGCPE